MSKPSGLPPGRGRDPLRFSRDELCSLIPHGGGMCLLERVEAWNSDAILCSTDSHREPDNPLRGENGLSAIHGLEYGAQAMAVHGALLTGGTQMRDAVVAAVHDLRLMVARLDTEGPRLRVAGHRLLEVGGSLVYNVRIDAGGAPLMTARVTVMSRRGPGS